MSGGKFNYTQYHISTIADSVESLVLNNKDTTVDEWGCVRGYDFPDEVIEKFKEAIPILKKAYIYSQRIDWLVSGDDGPDTFLQRLAFDLERVSNG